MKIRVLTTLLAVVLTAKLGRITFNGHQETYYNLNMTKVCERAAANGIIGEYRETEDGLKLYGDLIICAADFKTHPYGTIVTTSRGLGIVLDTGDFAKAEPETIDLATTWGRGGKNGASTDMRGVE